MDKSEICKAIELITSGVFECRIIKGKKILSGYFKDSEKLFMELERQDLRNANVYITLQRLHEGCEARFQWEHFLEPGMLKLPTTSDGDVVAYEWLPIDLDPKRPAGISSTKSELEAAYDLSFHIMEYMAAQGYNEYIRGFSGNGFHLLYRIANQGITEDHVQNVLNRLDALFSNDDVEVDTTVYNPSRVWKLYGTMAQKGRSTNSRPFRLAKILEVRFEEN